MNDIYEGRNTCNGKMAAEEESVDLGFAEKCTDSSNFLPSNFPSKLGGKPIWSIPKGIPQNTFLKCLNCHEQLIFLCQLYVPVDDIADDENKNSTAVLHKIIYLFCCLNGKCYNTNFCVKAFRMQIYENDLKTIAVTRSPFCNLCGCYGDKVCLGCSKVTYCCKKHQALDWNFSHGISCKRGSKNSKKNELKNPVLFDEYEIVIESEPTEDERNKRFHEKYKKHLLAYDQSTLDKTLEKDMSKIKENIKDEYFSKFKERTECELSQIVRYDLAGEPLWVTGVNIPKESDIVKCGCGSKRQFEFQVLPQMLNYLGVETSKESLDWATLAVYTCSENCSTERDGYVEEFVWKQAYSS